MGILLLFVLGIFVVLLVFISKTNKLVAKVEEIEASVRRLRRELEAGKPGTGVTAASEVAPERPQPLIREAAPTSPAPPQPTWPSATSAAVPEKPQAVAPPRPSRSRAEWEAFVGGKLLNRIGALALVIGVGFFLKYAFEHDWITEWMRVAIGVFIGVALLVAGARFCSKGFQVFAQGLVGAGVAILYLSVYASFNFYHLVSQGVAFLLMSAVTVVAFLHALKYNSLAVALLAWAGGFLTPFLLSTGESNELGLFSYIVLLDAGLLAVVARKDSWVILEPLTLGATYLTYLLWYAEYFRAEDLLLTAVFLTIFWGLFYAVDVLRVLTSRSMYPEARRVFAGFNAVFYYAAMYSSINPWHHDWMAPVTLAVGFVYFLTVLAARRKQVNDRMAVPQYALTAIALLVLATTIQYSGYTTVILWSVEAFLLVWVGRHWNLGSVWKAALGLFALSALKLYYTADSFGYASIETFTLVLNERTFAFVALSVALGASGLLFDPTASRGARVIRAWLNYGWCVVLFTLLTVETSDYFRKLSVAAEGSLQDELMYIRLLSLVAVWTAYSLPLVWFGMRKNVLAWSYSGFGALALAAVLAAIRGIGFEPIEHFTLAVNFRAFTLAFVVLGMFVHMRLLRTYRPTYDWADDLFGVVAVAVVLLMLVLITGETRDFFEKSIALLRKGGENTDVRDQVTRLRDLQQLSLSGVWLFYSIILMVTGLWRRARPLRLMAIGLFGVTILKIFIYDLSFLETLYRIFSFVGLGLILLAVSYLYQRYKTVILETSDT